MMINLLLTWRSWQAELWIKMLESDDTVMMVHKG